LEKELINRLSKLDTGGNSNVENRALLTGMAPAESARKAPDCLSWPWGTLFLSHWAGTVMSPRATSGIAASHLEMQLQTIDISNFSLLCHIQ